MPARWLIPRALLGGWGAAFFFWIGIEDTALTLVLLLGATLPPLLLLNFLTHTFPTQQVNLRLGLRGLLTGGAIPITISVLMALKVSLHAHTTAPDYAPQVVFNILARAPIWAGAGLLVGLAMALIIQSQNRERGL